MSGNKSKPQVGKGGECVNKLNEAMRGKERAKAQGEFRVGDDNDVKVQARAHERGADAGGSITKTARGNQEHGHYFDGQRVHGQAEAGLGGVKLDGGVGRTGYGFKDGDTHVKVANWDAGGKVAAGAGGVACKADLQVDAAKLETRHVDANVGLNASTGAEVGPDGVSAKFLGLGGGVNSKGVSISTPFGGVGFKW